MIWLSYSHAFGLALVEGKAAPNDIQLSFANARKG